VSIPPLLLLDLTSEIASQILSWHFAFPKVLDDFYKLEDTTLKWLNQQNRATRVKPRAARKRLQGTATRRYSSASSCSELLESCATVFLIPHF